MVNKISESAIETFIIDLLEKVGHDYIYALFTAADRDTLLPKLMSGEVRGQI